jgi:hypothetical protein
MNIAQATTESNAAFELQEIEALHRRCGIYTKAAVVERILDAVGWREDLDLSRATLLEPAAGDGAFVVEAGRRLVLSCLRHGATPTAALLKSRMRAFELHPDEADVARARVREALRELGVHHRTAASCARNWIAASDFLLADLPANLFTHVVGNPPYVRWAKIPRELKAKYNQALPRHVTGGDLFLPFLDRAFEALRPGGRCGFLCSDRWRYMAFAEGFRNRWLPRLEISSEDPIPAYDAFEQNVGSYPTILVASKKKAEHEAPVFLRLQAGQTLAELGCMIKVGPALGHTPAFVLEAGENGVEQELLRRWIAASEIAEGVTEWTGRHVVALHGADGRLIELANFPRLAARLERFREILGRRSIVRNGAPWFRTIDRVRAVDWMRPKLLVPELARVPRLAIDRSGAIPSHGVYAIFAPDDDIDTLYERLRDGKLAQALEGIAPRVKGNYLRCYRRFLEMIRLT